MRILITALLLCAFPVLGAAQAPPVDRTLSRLPPDAIVAVVDGVEIRLSDVDAFSRIRDPKKLFQLNQQLFNLREWALSTMIGERLLAGEAAEAGMTVEELVDKLAVAPVDENEVEAMLVDALRRNGNIAPELLRPMIREFLRDQRRNDARARHIQELKLEQRQKGKPVAIKLEPPRVMVPVAASDPTKGSGPIEILEFSDFECPHCQKAQPMIRELLAKYEGKVKLVWKDFPLPGHDHAVPAAGAARCAQEQGKFWEYHDVLFANQHALAAADLRRHAATVGLDLSKFDACVRTGQYQDAILSQLKSGNDPVDVTPTFLINGRMVAGNVPLHQLSDIIDQELGN